MNGPTHIRVNSLSSKGSLSDYSTILRTPQDSVQSENDALIVKQADENTSGSGAWKPSMTLVKETLTSSPLLLR
ncbi:17306_t:CDS:1, partial [Acaulospora colombiana]